MIGIHVLEQIQASLLQVLKNRGVRKGFCPFHNDKHPSASIKTGKFHCFRCQLHLDAIDFVRKYHSIDFRAAVEMMADELGIPLQDNVRSISGRQIQSALPEARLFVAWREDLLRDLGRYEWLNLRLYHRLKALIIHGIVEGEEWASTAHECELAEQRYLFAEQARDIIQSADEFLLLQIWRSRADWAA